MKLSQNIWAMPEDKNHIVAVKASFVCAHRLVLDYIGQCQPLHGHEINIIAKFSGQLDGGTMVADFDMIKADMQKWLTDNWDHNLLLSDQDKKLGEAVSQITKQKVFYFNGNPSAENMAKVFYNNCATNIADKMGVTAIEVEVVETNNYSTTYKINNI